MRHHLLVLLILLTPAAAQDVEVSFAKGQSVEAFIREAATAGGGVFLYVPDDVAGKTIGGPYSLAVPKDRYRDVVSFILKLRNIPTRTYDGLWPITIVLPATATTSKFTIAGTESIVEFNRPPAGWRRMSDAEATMTAESAEALAALVSQGSAPGSDRAAAVLGLCAPRTRQVLTALHEALDSNDEPLKMAAADALGRCGYSARFALPKLKKTEGAEQAVKAIENAVSPALLNPALAKDKAPDVFRVKFETTKGDIVVEATRAWSPIGADRFYNMVKIGYFTDIAFFRMASFVVQFGIHGDPRVNGAWRNANIRDDPVRQSNKIGTIAFANSGRNSRTVQLFINILKNNAGRRNLDAMGFSPFAKIVEGMDVVAALNREYGEDPNQQRLQFEGNAYLKKSFPNLDYIKSATLLK